MKSSILNPAELDFVRRRVLGLRREQLENIVEDEVLSEFITAMSPQNEVVAWDEGGSRVAWNADTGFEAKFAEGFFNDAGNVTRCFRAARKAFFEDFLDEDSRKSLGSHSQQGEVDHLETELEEASDDVLDTVSQADTDSVEEVQGDLAEVEGADALVDEEPDTVPADLDEMKEVEAEEPDPAQESLQMPEGMDDDFDPEAMLAKVDDAHGSIAIDEDAAQAADEFSNLAASEDDDEEDSSAAETEVADDSVDSSVDTSEDDSEPEESTSEEAGPDEEVTLEQLREEMHAAGMAEAKMSKLLAAIKSGKASIDAVRKTLKKAG